MEKLKEKSKKKKTKELINEVLNRLERDGKLSQTNPGCI